MPAVGVAALLAPDLAPFLRTLHTLRRQRPLLAALDPSAGLGAADREAFLFALDSTISDGKSRDLQCNNISVQLFCYDGGEGAAVVSASVSEPEDE